MFLIDTASRQPVYEQIVTQTEELILKGILKPGDKMPSVRNLSLTLGINPNTIQKAYSELDTRGLIYSQPGKGCFVSENANANASKSKKKSLGALTDLISDLKLAGVSLDEIVGIAEEIYKGGDER